MFEAVVGDAAESNVEKLEGFDLGDVLEYAARGLGASNVEMLQFFQCLMWAMPPSVMFSA